MKLFICSDIHGIVKNLDKLKNAIETENADKVVVLGDLYYAGPTYTGDAEVASFKVHEYLQSIRDNLVGVKGNCDSPVDLKASDFPIHEGLFTMEVNGVELSFAHGNEHSMKRNAKVPAGCNLIYGHEHIPYIEKQDGTTFVCVGSVSLPKENNPPTYAVFENTLLQIKSLIDGKVLKEINL